MKFLLTLSVLLVCTFDPVSAADSVCKDSSNTDTNNNDACKYLSPCTDQVVPSEPSGYTLECETMPCPSNQDIMFDRIDGTDVGELLPADCDNTVLECAEACDETIDCCGFNFVFNPGQYDSQSIGRCVGECALLFSAQPRTN
jgi:hypothetical protein